MLGELVAVRLERGTEGAGRLVVAEGSRQTLLDPLDRLAVLLLNGLAVGVGEVLELPPDVVDLGCDLLPVEHPGADLDRPTNHLRRLLAGTRRVPGPPARCARR